MNKMFRILLIEDNPGDARLIEEMLKEAGVQFEMECVERLSSGIGQIKIDGFDVILLDLGLPDSQGLATLTKLNEIKPDAPVIVLTGLADEATGIQAIKEGAQDYLIKGQMDKNLLSRSINYAVERKQLEESLNKQRKQFETFFDNTITPLAFLDKDFNFIRVNKAYADADEKEISYFPGRNHFELYPSEAKTIFEEVVRTKIAFQTFARPFIYPDHPEWGVTYWDWTLMPILDNNREVEFLAFSLVDVTERKKTEELIRNILESVDEVFMIIDRDYRIISANRAFTEKTNVSLEDAIGRHCYEISHHCKKPCFEMGEDCTVNHVFETGEPHVCIHTHYNEEGNPIYVETKAYPMKDASGKVISAIEIMNDITDKRKLDEQLRQLQKMEAVGQLAGGIAHDFNNILTAIMGYANMISMKLAKEDPLRAYVEPILSASDKAAALTQSLLIFSRKQISNLRPVNLNEVVKNVEKFLERIIGEHIGLNVILSDKELTVMADAGQIEQVLMNLVTNARDAMPDGGILDIETDVIEMDAEYVRRHGYGKAGRYGLISVTDSGKGMDEKTRQKIYEPFFTTKEAGKGTGLGLAIVYGIVKTHKGFINCYSEINKGTSFKIYLPLIEARVSENREAAPGIAQLPGGTETILVAEDEEQVREFTAELLRSFGYHVIEAVDGEDAINKFMENKEKIKIIVLDVIMPKMNGREVYERIRKISPDMKTIFASGYPADFIQKEAILETGVSFLSKPVSPTLFLNKVREVLGAEKQGR